MSLSINSDSLSDDEQDNYAVTSIINGYSSHDLSIAPMNIEPIAFSSITSNLLASKPSSQECYQQKTLSNGNYHRRFHLLPKLPNSATICQPSNHLLLTNIPLLSLSVKQLCRRCYNFDDLTCYENATLNSATEERTKLLYQHFIQLSEQWQVPKILLIFNCQLMTSSMSQLSLEDFVSKVPLLKFSIEEWKLALEFYLQMDIDCFFLKTCSFRGSQPRTLNYISRVATEGLFCMESPEARYGMKRCHYQKCLFCHLPNRTQRHEPALNFTNHQIHTFVNQYQAILNCDVTCFSSHIVYALTCPCKEYDYCGRTSGVFYKRLYFHRLQCSRVIRECLLGKEIVHQLNPSSKSERILKKDSMDLYRHITHCHVALQVFLNHHSVYWCFVPMTNAEADIDDQLHISNDTRHSLLQFRPKKAFNQPEETLHSLSDQDVYWCIDHLPLPPGNNYRFSNRQRQEQYNFFKIRMDLWPLCQHLDIYNATIVLALPNDCSTQLLHFVQALLVTHAECKLNTNNNCQPPHFDRSSNWCQYLKRPLYDLE